MSRLARSTAGLCLVLASMAGQAMELAYEPVGLGWSAKEVEDASLGSLRSLAGRAARDDLMGCHAHCERLERVFARLVIEARTQNLRSASLPWTLAVVRLADVDALALPGGQVVVSEAVIDRRALSDEALAFVLAHEMAHSILEHERQALTFARMLLPRDVPRTVADMYTEMDYNLGLLASMEPALHQGELEADELGLLMASLAGFAPDRQLAFIEMEAAEAVGARSLFSTHPPARLRLEKLRALLPLARRLLPVESD